MSETMTGPWVVCHASPTGRVFPTPDNYGSLLLWLDARSAMSFAQGLTLRGIEAASVCEVTNVAALLDVLDQHNADFVVWEGDAEEAVEFGEAMAPALLEAYASEN